MTWKPIVAGVDASPQAATAAAFAWRIAQAANTECYLVHGSRPLFRSAAAEFVADVNALIEQQMEAARMGVSATIERAVPATALRALEVRSGRGATVVTEVARRYHAGLIVLGGKHHSTLGRWMGGSTAHHVVRVTDIPLLVTGEQVGAMRRVLVSADLSYAVQPTFEAAARMARLFGAELRVLHAVEPLPVFAELPALWNEEAFYQDSTAQLERCLEPLLEDVVAESVVRPAYAADAIAAEVAAWGADLVVVGSHGKGWVDRLLLGSTTERLLDQLPASLLVVPVPAPPGERRPGRAERLARRARQTVARSMPAG
ncbi:MAG: universal stress protein [Gemmatimonadetes bacterium]|nr:universal stress protein [Gemmatimonadota bacterium]